MKRIVAGTIKNTYKSIAFGCTQRWLPKISIITEPIDQIHGNCTSNTNAMITITKISFLLNVVELFVSMIC